MPLWQLSHQAYSQKVPSQQNLILAWGTLIKSRSKTKLDKTVKVHMHLLYSFRRRPLFTRRDIQPIPTLISQQQLHIRALSNRSSTLQLRWNPSIPVSLATALTGTSRQSCEKQKRPSNFFTTSPSCCHKRISDHTLLPGDPKGRQNSHSPCSLNCICFYMIELIALTGILVSPNVVPVVCFWCLNKLLARSQRFWSLKAALLWLSFDS